MILGVVVERLGDIDNTNDLDGLAALMTACDAVVTREQHRRRISPGALSSHFRDGAARARPHRYWFHDRDRSPWYPRVAVRRQQSGQPWADVVAAVAREVSALVDLTSRVDATIVLRFPDHLESAPESLRLVDEQAPGHTACSANVIGGAFFDCGLEARLLSAPAARPARSCA